MHPAFIRCAAVIFSITFLFNSASSQDTLLHRYRATETQLQALQKDVFFSRNEKQRMESNRQFLSLWQSLADNPYALDFPFDSLREVSNLRSPDGNVRLVTWSIPRDDGSFLYCGFLMARRVKRIRTGLFRHTETAEYGSYMLLDRSMLIKSPESHMGTPDKWFGMLYTKMIPCDGYYTLLGWDGNDKLTTRKFIDVLHFRSDGTPLFGKDVFRIPRKNPRRLMFEYSSEVTMSLRYNEKSRQIVASHLSSPKDDGTLDGQFQFYGPDGTYDALVQRDGKWVIVEDIDARNAKNKNDNAEKPDPKKQTKLYDPK